MNVESIIRQGQGTVVDVRTRGEFSNGHAQEAINIPLNELETRLEELKAMNKPLVLCCASGARSGQAHYFLSKKGIECCNGGSWLEVLNYQPKKQ